MNYELAKELKDKGFPQHSLVTHIGQEIGMSEPDGSEYVRTPTLFELIEACGDGIFSLEFYPKTKDCIAHPRYRSTGVNGTTPEEAVARLWLTLNSK